MFKKIFWLIVLGWCSTCLFIRCYMNFAGFHTGRTTGKGGHEIRGSVSKVFDSPIFAAFDEEFSDFKLRDQTAVEFGGMVGVAKRVDVGAWMNFFGGIGLDTKVQLLGDHDSPFAMAVGAGIGQRNKFFFHIPVYLSYHPVDGHNLYLSPRYIYQPHDTYTYAYGKDPFKFWGLNAGYFASFNRFSVGFDYAFYRGGKNKMDFKTGSLGLGIRWRIVRD